jgi:hypothetical protein
MIQPRRALGDSPEGRDWLPRPVVNVNHVATDARECREAADGQVCSIGGQDG